MKVRSATVLLLLSLLSSLVTAQQPEKTPAHQPASTVQAPEFIANKKAAVAWLDQHGAGLSAISDKVWAYAETALREVKSSRALADYAEKQGFKVQRGASGMPTAIIATYGEGKPVIGIMGEYDALPGVSQKAIPTKEPLQAGAPGHGCGHNLFGAASLGAATAIKQLIAEGKLKGTIKFFGTPAEEAVGGKIYMARDGLFNDVDVMLAWHPADQNSADTDSSQALVDFIVEFHGKAAHAAFDPWNGRSAEHAAEFFVNGVNGLREHVRPTVRMHYVIVKAGDVPNVVPEYSKVWMWVRDSKRTGVDTVLARVRDIAKGAALMAGVQENFTIQSGDYEMNVNMTGERLIHSNMTWLGPQQFTPDEQQFAKTIQQTTSVEPVGLVTDIKPFEDHPGEPKGGSTDVGDVSWIVPTLHVSITTAPKDAPWHAWPVVATGGMSIGHKGMLYASKVLATTMVDLFSDANMREAIRTEFDSKVKSQTYKPYIPEGPPPVPAEVMAEFDSSKPKPQTDK